MDETKVKRVTLEITRRTIIANHKTKTGSYAFFENDLDFTKSWAVSTFTLWIVAQLRGFDWGWWLIIYWGKDLNQIISNIIQESQNEDTIVETRTNLIVKLRSKFWGSDFCFAPSPLNC